MTTKAGNSFAPSLGFLSNSLWLLLGRVSSQMLVFIFSILAARSLGEAGLGQYALISALVFFANVVTTFGTDTQLIREVARHGSASAGSFKAVLCLQVCCSLLSIGGFVLIAPHLPGKTSETALSLQVLAFSLLPLAYTTVFSAVLRGHQRMDLYLFSSLFTALAQTAGAAFLLWSGGGLLELSWLIVLSQTLNAVFGYYLCRPFLMGSLLPWKASFDQVFFLIWKSWPLALLAGLGIAYQRMGVLLLSFMAGDAATGWFSAASRLTEGFKVFHIAMLGALFPILSSFHGTVSEIHYGSDQGKWIPYRGAFMFLMSYAILAAIVVGLFAEPIVSLLFGTAFAPSSAALQVLVMTLIPYTLVSLVSLDLVARGAEQQALAGLAVTIAAALPLHMVLISRYGLQGACWAAVGSEILQVGVLFLIKRRARSGKSSQRIWGAD